MSGNKVIFGVTSKGKPSVIHKHYEFVKHRNYTNGNIQWRCKLYQTAKCTARITTKDDEIVSNCNPEHSHIGNKENILARYAVLEMKAKMNDISADSNAIIASVVNQLSPDVQMALPKKQSLKRALDRKRQKLQICFPFPERTVPKPTYSYVIHKHQGNMLTNMAELWKKGKFCDATIGNGTMKIMVHKIVLVALSPGLLNLRNQDLDSGCIQVNFPKEIKADALWEFTKFMYEGVVSLNEDVLEDMERISRILQLQDLQDMCQLYRSQVNLPSDTLSSSIFVKNNSSTNLPSNLNSLQPSIQSDTTSNNVSVLNLPSGNITQTISRPVQHLQILPPGQSDLEMSYSNQQSPLMDLKLSPGHTLSNAESDIIIVNSEVKQERLSPVNIPQYQDKDLLIALSSRQSDNQLYLHDDYSEPWQPSSSHQYSELTGPSPNKQLKPNNDLQISDPHTLIKNELDDLEKKSNDVPCEMTLVPVEDVT